MTYPTKEEILESPFPASAEEIELFALWKREDWNRNRKKGEGERAQSIGRLLCDLARHNGQQVPRVTYDPVSYAGAHYRPATRHIVLSDTSIITALHELAHHFYGPSELDACRYSVTMFRAVFPRAYRKLEWRGHMLVRA